MVLSLHSIKFCEDLSDTFGLVSTIQEYEDDLTINADGVNQNKSHLNYPFPIRFLQVVGLCILQSLKKSLKMDMRQMKDPHSSTSTSSLIMLSLTATESPEAQLYSSEEEEDRGTTRHGYGRGLVRSSRTISRVSPPKSLLKQNQQPQSGQKMENN